jgi:tetratricopeptide (TPR) repeat protein
MKATGWGHGQLRLALLVLLIGLVFLCGPAKLRGAEDILAPIKARLELARELEGQAPAGTMERAQLLLASGEPENAWEAARALPADDVDAEIVRATAAFVLYDFGNARTSLEKLLRRAPDREETRRLQVRWFLSADDLQGLDHYCGRVLQQGPASPAALLGLGWLDLKLMGYEQARVYFEDALSAAVASWDSVRALEGIGDVLYEEQKFDSSLVCLKKAIPLPAADDRLLESVTLTLIRLGRVGEAIEAAELAVKMNPFNERAQYTLGNGYSRLNYSELEAADPQAFPDHSEALMIAAIDSAMAAGARDVARERLLEMAGTHPNLTDVHVRLGSLAFEDGDLDAAFSHFRAGLAACPGNGRARNGVSKALEAKRMAIDVHRQSYEKSFAEAPWPQIPGIERFVINYSYLSDRHKKRVAMSIAPWAQFVPVLIESGSTYYIKPLYQRLSECPGLETMKDQRIDYDSRLWDDVRGCGGYTTVTGIEDVERTVLNQYNTVLHELTHQVHGVLTTDETRDIQDLYRKAKEREQAGEKTFLSRYQGSSVWEYFAEGANSLMTPRRDRYDTREIVRERLEERDPELASLVGRIMSVTNMEPYYAVGYANAGYDRLEKDLVDEAVEQFRKALERDPKSAEGQAGLIYALSIKGDNQGACEMAERALFEHPDDARILLEASRAFYHRDGDLRGRIKRLETARDRIEERDRYLIDLELGQAYLTAGDLESAMDSFGRALDYQDDNHEALWGMGMSMALAGDIRGASDYFDKAIRRRSGLVDLRADYAMALIESGDLDGALAQLDEAKLLDKEDSGVAALEGWIALRNGDQAAASAELERALDLAQYNDLARILLAQAKLAAGDPQEAWQIAEPLLSRVQEVVPPEYIYRKKTSSFKTVHEFPAWQKQLLYRVASDTARQLGRVHDAEGLDRLSKEAVRVPQ